jgi:hypothetical protein
MKKKGARLIKESTKEGKARVKAEMDLQVATFATVMLLQLVMLLLCFYHLAVAVLLLLCASTAVTYTVYCNFCKLLNPSAATATSTATGSSGAAVSPLLYCR